MRNLCQRAAALGRLRTIGLHALVWVVLQPRPLERGVWAESEVAILSYLVLVVLAGVLWEPQFPCQLDSSWHRWIP